MLSDDWPMKPEKVGWQPPQSAEAESASCLPVGRSTRAKKDKRVSRPFSFSSPGGWLRDEKRKAGGLRRRLDGRHACVLRCEPLIEQSYYILLLLVYMYGGAAAASASAATSLPALSDLLRRRQTREAALALISSHRLFRRPMRARQHVDLRLAGWRRGGAVAEDA